MSSVQIMIFFLFLCGQINLYAQQAISATPHPFNKYQTFLIWTLIMKKMKKILYLMFVTRNMKEPVIKTY